MIVRKSAFDMAETKAQSAFIDAVNKLNGDKKYAPFVNQHANMRKHAMHSMGFKGQVGMWRFLAWHRIYLIRFEKALRAYDSSVYIPYWKWTDGGVPKWMETFMPTIPGVIKNPGASKPTVTTETTVRTNIHLLSKRMLMILLIITKHLNHSRGH